MLEQYTAREQDWQRSLPWRGREAEQVTKHGRPFHQRLIRTLSYVQGSCCMQTSHNAPPIRPRVLATLPDIAAPALTFI